MGKNASEVRRDIEQIRSNMDGTLDELGDRVSPKRIYERRTERVRSGVRAVRDSVMGSADSATSATQGALHGVGDAASAAAGRVGDTPEIISAGARGNPLAAGFISFGIGLLLGSLPPASKQEQQLARAVAPQLEPIRDKALESAQRVGADVQEAATDAAHHVRDDAASAAGEVRDQAQDAAHHVTSDAKAAASDVRQQATDNR